MLRVIERTESYGSFLKCEIVCDCRFILSFRCNMLPQSSGLDELLLGRRLSDLGRCVGRLCGRLARNVTN